MKTTVSTRSWFATSGKSILTKTVMSMLLTGSLSDLAFAQKASELKAKKDELHVRIIERTGDRVQEVNRTYRINGMTDQKRDELVKNLVDSLRLTRKGEGKSQLTIILEDGNSDLKRIRPGRPDAYVRRPDFPRGEFGPGFFYFKDGKDKFDFNMEFDSLANRLNRLELKMPRNLEYSLIEPFEAWSRGGTVVGKPSTVRSLDIYPNNPDRNLLNIRFVAPAKGDVTILVTTPKGKEVARKDVKDFAGEYVGQIDLGKKAQGTYFVTVTQNEDGAVKRVVIP